MDDTGSTTFVLFDHQVTQLIGRNVQDLINEREKVVDECMVFMRLIYAQNFQLTSYNFPTGNRCP